MDARRNPPAAGRRRQASPSASVSPPPGGGCDLPTSARSKRSENPPLNRASSFGTQLARGRNEQTRAAGLRGAKLRPDALSRALVRNEAQAAYHANPFGSKPAERTHSTDAGLRCGRLRPADGCAIESNRNAITRDNPPTSATSYRSAADCGPPIERRIEPHAIPPAPRGPSDTKRPAPPKTTHVGNTPCPPTCHRSNGSCRSARRRETPPTGIPHARRRSRHVSEPFLRLCRTPPKTPPPRSYRCLERHFPRPCGPPTRVRHPYRPPFVRSSDQQRPNSRRQHRRRTSRAPFPVAAMPRRRNPRRILPGCHTPSEQQILSSRAVAKRPQSRRERAPERRKRRKNVGERGSNTPSRRRCVVTSWPSSRPGSGPSKPSRGTGYG